MVTDVLGWVNDASVNFGWILRGNESAALTAKRFASRENSNVAQRPQLTVIYTSTVPVVLTSFSAKETTSGSLLTWQTAHELNNDFFLVQHSSEGVNFSTIGRVKGNGNKPDVSNYQFRHEGTVAGRHFYRLAQTDISGKVQYSAIRAINISKQSFSMQVSPNPVVDRIIITSSLNQPGTPYSILNGIGSVVAGGRLTPAGINVKVLAIGTYYLRLQQQDGSVITGIFYKK